MKIILFMVFTLAMVMQETVALFQPLDQALAVPELKFNVALKLCKAINASTVLHRDRFLWTPLRTDAEIPNSPPTVVPACSKFIWSPCQGAPRYPLGRDCGHWQTVSLSQGECDEERAGDTITVPEINSNGKGEGKSIPTVQIDHTPAVQLCTMMESLQNQFEALSIKYIPIRVDINPNDGEHFSRECVSWKYSKCGLDKNSASGPCDQWTILTSTTPQCSDFRDFWSQEGFNNTNKILSRFRTRTMNTLDFFEDDQHKEENLKIESDSEMGLMKEETPFGTELAPGHQLDVITNLIACRYTAKGSLCTILPKQNNHRSKRQYSPYSYRRYPRRCCGVFGCFECGVSLRLMDQGRSYQLPYPGACDCGGRICRQDPFYCTELRYPPIPTQCNIGCSD